MINRVILVGRLTADPELKYTTSGVPVVTFTLAVNRTFSNQSGERDADFIQCVAWRAQAENMAKFLSKGRLIGVEGRIQTRTYDAQDGSKRYVTEVVSDNVQFLEPRSSMQPGQGAQGGQYQQQQQQPFGGYQQQQNSAPRMPQQSNNNPNFGFNNNPGSGSFNIENNDPFMTSPSNIDISDDDLPF